MTCLFVCQWGFTRGYWVAQRDGINLQRDFSLLDDGPQTQQILLCLPLTHDFDWSSAWSKMSVQKVAHAQKHVLGPFGHGSWLASWSWDADIIIWSIGGEERGACQNMIEGAFVVMKMWCNDFPSGGRRGQKETSLSLRQRFVQRLRDFCAEWSIYPDECKSMEGVYASVFEPCCGKWRLRQTGLSRPGWPSASRLRQLPKRGLFMSLVGGRDVGSHILNMNQNNSCILPLPVGYFCSISRRSCLLFCPDQLDVLLFCAVAVSCRICVLWVETQR